MAALAFSSYWPDLSLFRVSLSFDYQYKKGGGLRYSLQAFAVFLLVIALWGRRAFCYQLCCQSWPGFWMSCESGRSFAISAGLCHIFISNRSTSSWVLASLRIVAVTLTATARSVDSSFESLLVTVLLAGYRTVRLDAPGGGCCSPSVWMAFAATARTPPIPLPTFLVCLGKAIHNNTVLASLHDGECVSAYSLFLYSPGSRGAGGGDSQW